MNRQDHTPNGLRSWQTSRFISRIRVHVCNLSAASRIDVGVIG